MAAETGQSTSRLLNKMAYDIANKAADIGTAASGDLVLIADISDDYEVKWGDGANLLEMVGSVTGATMSGAFTVGVDATGYDVKFFGDTTGKYWLWDESADSVVLVGNEGITGTATITSASASALAVGLAGATNPSFVVDSATGSQAAGLKVTGATAAGTVAAAVISSGSDANLTINAKGTGTIGIGSVSTGAVTITPATTVTGAITPTGGVAAAGGFTLKPVGWHTGGIGAQVSTDGSDVTPSVSEMYYAAIQVPANATLTGVAVFLGSATEGNMKVGLFNSSGVLLKTSVTTDISGATVDAYFRIAFTGGTYAAVGPATYYVGIMQDSTSNRFNAHTFGDFPAGKTTGETYATGFTSFTPATTFTTALGPYASLY